MYIINKLPVVGVGAAVGIGGIVVVTTEIGI